MEGLRSKLCCCGPGLFVTAAFCLSLASSSGCSFLKLDEGNDRRNPPLRFDTIGFWCYQVENSSDRFAFSDFSIDDDFKKARAFGLTANILGFCVWLFMLFAACVNYGPKLYSIAGFFALLVCLFEGLKFWMLKSTFFCDGSDLGCSYDTYGACSISAIVLWFISTCMTCAQAKQAAMAPAEDEEREAPVDEEKGEDAPEAALDEGKGAADEEEVEA